MKIDEWIWGKEQIISEFDRDFTIKILIPKDGINGVLSLQSHQRKLEYWIILSGRGVVQFFIDDLFYTLKVSKGMLFRIPPGVPHRLGSIQSLKVLEVSTLDEHSLDKAKPKDVVRYHCFHGRECTQGLIELNLLQEAVKTFESFFNNKKNFKQKPALDRLQSLRIYLGKIDL